ncbi:nacht and ankyrin domain protein [Colletotrichum kahawae]|uniref:Nacht and ankyrin domain protein n=1 Tax=Colletotrichum kahawae TaxID=34407 RepID=A0AAE0DAU8_COLKA|nr:nacht and ankyrin domain protein [Colletotrichum kahawae]
MAEPIGLAASLLALLELSIKTIDYIQSAKGATKERAQLTAEIQFCQVIVGGLRDVSDNAGWKQTMEVLIQPGAPLKLLEETLQRLVQKLSPKTGIRHRLHALKWPFEEKEVKSILDMIERQKASLSLALDNNSSSLEKLE